MSAQKIATRLVGWQSLGQFTVEVVESAGNVHLVWLTQGLGGEPIKALANSFIGAQTPDQLRGLADLCEAALALRGVAA